MLAIAPTSVTSKPSRIHVIPSPTTTNQCHRLHGSRTRRRVDHRLDETGLVSRPSVASRPSRSSVAFRTRWKPAAVSAPLSTSRHIQPWPLSGLELLRRRAADGREDASASELPFLDLVVVALDLGAELDAGLRAGGVLDCREPGLGITVGVDAAQLNQVVLEPPRIRASV